MNCNFIAHTEYTNWCTTHSRDWIDCKNALLLALEKVREAAENILPPDPYCSPIAYEAYQRLRSALDNVKE